MNVFSLQRQQPARFITGCLLCFAFTASFSVHAYERIVSATGNASEIIAELGLADKLVAVDTTSTLPADIMANKPKIGYRRALSAEGILSMQPDLLILAPDAGPPTILQQLTAANLPAVTIQDKKTVDGVIADIEMLADTLKVTESAKPLIARIRADESTLKQRIADYPATPKMAFLMDSGMGGSRLLALGDGTAGDAMLTLVGGDNVFDTFKGVKPVSAEAMAATEMNIIIIAAHGKGVKAAGKPENATADYPHLALTKAGQNRCIFRIGTVEALGFGVGFSQAANEIAATVTPCLEK